MQQEEEFKAELFSRVETFFGEAGFANVSACHVVVVGIGGVGSHAASMLVRSGIGSVRLIDFDNVTLSSLNRHAVATISDVGTPKTVATSKALKRVVPWYVCTQYTHTLYHFNVLCHYVYLSFVCDYSS